MKIDKVAAFTWQEMFDALIRTFPARFPDRASIANFRCDLDHDKIVVNLRLK